MKRDLELVRDLLLKIEAGQKVFETLSSEYAAMLHVTDLPPLTQAEADALLGHLDLLENAGLIEISSRSTSGSIYVKGLTWSGHDFLDSVRDPEIWAKTKKGAEEAKGFTFDLLKDLAKGFIRTQIKERTGIDV